MNRPAPLHLVLAGVLIAGVGLDVVAPSTLAGAPNHKTFAVTVGPNATSTTTSYSIPVGTFPTLFFTITNKSNGPQAVPFGSLQLQAPSGITITGAHLVSAPNTFNANLPLDVSSTAVTLTSTGPTGSGVGSGSSVTISVDGSATSGVCPGTWGVRVKQSNDFSGSGNDFLAQNTVSTPVAGGSQLVWTTQPSDTEFDLDMNPSPQVTLEDACGNPVPIVGTPTVSASTGNMTTPTISVSGGTATFGGVQFSEFGLVDVTLTATANGVSATSDPFQVYQWYRDCGTNGCKTGTLAGPNNQTLVGITVNPADSTDKLSVNVKGEAADLNDGRCSAVSDIEPPLGELVSFNIANHSKTVTVTLPKTYVNQIPNNGTPFMDICLDVGSAGLPFFDKNHYLVDPTTPKVTFGLLPDCTSTGSDGGPCITSRKKNAGNEVITLTAPEGDPNLMWR